MIQIIASEYLRPYQIYEKRGLKMRKKKAALNFCASIIQEIVTLICGLILPRLILAAFGSKYNGITSSITQFLQVIALLRAGVGGVTRASLYKPLANNDFDSISRIIKATEIFMRKVAGIFAIFLIAMAFFYPLLVRDDFSKLFSSSLVLILGISTLAQYYFGITYQMLLQADQRQYINSTISIISMIVNTMISVVLIKVGAGIHLVKLGSAIVYAINPIIIYLYVKKRYKIRKNVLPDNTAIKQRWDALVHQIAAFIHSNTDVMVITIFCDIKEVSVYTIYHMISYNVKTVVNSFSAGMSAAFGDMLAKKEYEVLKKNVMLFELLMYSVSAIIFSSASLLIVPFVSIYTHGITDCNYIRPLFGYLIIFSELIYCIRIPYLSVVEAAGHFKQTRNGALIEALVNISVSILAVQKLGLVGVCIGTIIAMLFRTVQYALYMNKKILRNSIFPFIKRGIVLLINICLILVIGNYLLLGKPNTYYSWTIYAIVTTLIATVCTLFLDLIFYHKDTKILFSIVSDALKRKSQKEIKDN